MTGTRGGTSLANRIKKFVTERHLADELNGVVLFAEQGKIVCDVAAGFASANNNTPLRSDSVFRIGSLTKAFTALAILQLRELNRLQLDDDIRQHLPEIRYEGILVTDLIHHTSGLPEYIGLSADFWDAQWRAHGKGGFARGEFLLAGLARLRDDLAFDPGKGWAYSNTGYALLGVIVERASTLAFGTYLERKIFSRLNMTSAVLFDPENPAEIRHRAFGFKRRNGRRVPSDQHVLDGIYGDGGIYASVLDLLKWHRALYTDALLSRESLRLMFSSGQLGNGAKHGYGFGWFIEESWGHRSAHHYGKWLGFQASMDRDLDEDRVLIILSNDSNEAFGKVRGELRKIVS